MAIVNVIACISFLIPIYYATVSQYYLSATLTILCFIAALLYHSLLTYNGSHRYIKYCRILDLSVCHLSGLYFLSELILFTEIYYMYIVPALLCLGYCLVTYHIIIPLCADKYCNRLHATIQIASNAGILLHMCNKVYGNEAALIDDHGI